MADYIKEPHTRIFTGPTDCGKSHFVLELIEKECNKHLTTLSLSAQHFDGIRHIMLEAGSEMMIRFGL